MFAIYRPRELSHLVAQVSPSPSSEVPVAPGGCEAAQTRSKQIIIRPENMILILWRMVVRAYFLPGGVIFIPSLDYIAVSGGDLQKLPKKRIFHLSLAGYWE